ncbi:MAG TPA: thioredoxin domain-containing protein [Rhizomicrobium sp.]|nr:thioredoxin domain-containing protein [Rhizomicrobium sp.]
MSDWVKFLAASLGGAFLAVVIVFAAADRGFLPGGPGGGDIRTYLLSHPELVAEMTDRLQKQEEAADAAKAAATMKKVGLAPFFDSKVAFVTGPADAKKSVVEFYDYNCPYCRASLPAVEKFYRQHKNDTRFSFIEFPIKGPDSIVAARVALAARLQPDKYLALHFLLMNETDPVNEAIIYADAQKAGLNMAKLKVDMENPAIDDAIAASKQLAMRAGIDGTPTFIINGVMHPGAVDDELIDSMAGRS